MSFALTEAQILDRSKWVTRRLGWLFLKEGDILQPIRKGMGLKPGEKIVKLGAPIIVIGARREPLRRMTDDVEYGLAEVEAEGFAEHPLVMGSPMCFVDFFCNANSPRCRPDTVVTRIAFDYA